MLVCQFLCFCLLTVFISLDTMDTHIHTHTHSDVNFKKQGEENATRRMVGRTFDAIGDKTKEKLEGVGNDETTTECSGQWRPEAETGQCFCFGVSWIK